MFKDEQGKNDELLAVIAKAVGGSVTDVQFLELFEHTIYDMARSVIALPEIDFMEKGYFEIENDRIRITYPNDLIFTHHLSSFFLRYFPDTHPQHHYTHDHSISLLLDPFIQKVLPAIELWRRVPDCFVNNTMHFVAEADRLLKCSLNPGYGNAVYITGSDEALGAWKTAYQLTYNKNSGHWEFKLPPHVKSGAFKFLTGLYEDGEVVSTAKLKYEAGENRTMVMTAPLLAVNNNLTMHEYPLNYVI